MSDELKCLRANLASLRRQAMAQESDDSGTVTVKARVEKAIGECIDDVEQAIEESER